MLAGKLFRWIVNAFRAVIMIITRPKNLYHVLHNEEVYQKLVARKFPEFQGGLPEVSLNQLTDEINGKIETYSFLGGTSEPIDLLLLQILAKKFTSCKYLEIGTWRGESVTNLKDVTAIRYSVNLSSEQLNKKSYSAEEIEVQDFYLANDPGWIQLKGDSKTLDFSELPTMNLVFIDGDHHREMVKSDTKKVFQYLVEESTIVVWHDYTQHFSSIWWEVLLGILEGVSALRHDRLFHVRNTNCAVYLPFDINGRSPTNRWKPRINFEVTIKAK